MRESDDEDIRAELEAAGVILKALSPLSGERRALVLRYVVDRLKLRRSVKVEERRAFDVVAGGRGRASRKV